MFDVSDGRHGLEFGGNHVPWGQTRKLLADGVGLSKLLVDGWFRHLGEGFFAANELRVSEGSWNPSIYTQVSKHPTWCRIFFHQQYQDEIHPHTNSLPPENRPFVPKGKEIDSQPFFSGDMLVSGSVCRLKFQT